MSETAASESAGLANWKQNALFRKMRADVHCAGAILTLFVYGFAALGWYLGGFGWAVGAGVLAWIVFGIITHRIVRKPHSTSVP